MFCENEPMGYIGNYMVDKKFRVVIPCTLKAEKKSEVLAVVDFGEDFLRIYPEKTILEKQKEALLNKDMDSFLAYSKAAYAKVDNSSRYIIPKDFLEAKNIKDRCIIIGGGDCIFIWSVETYNKKHEAACDKKRERIRSKEA